jgi:hypothetical protein
MSEEELLAGFTSGTISRRAFVRRLIAGGLSVAAAVEFADAIAPAVAGAVTKAKNVRKTNHHPHHPHDDPHRTEDHDADDLS